MIQFKWRIWYILLTLVALAASLGLALSLLSPPEPVDPTGWSLTDLVEHLDRRGLPLRVVPARQDGCWGNDIYLTQDPALTWIVFQRKGKAPDRARQWRGSVWVRRLGDWNWQVPDWGPNGCRIGGFLLFGDERLLERMKQTFQGK
jgi:hypothetical protein